MSITIDNRRIIPYNQKDTIKAVFGDALVLTFDLPDHEAGDTYTLALDYERVLLPTMRPVCALATEYTASGTDITMVLDINTERFAAWASRQKKPMPIWLQLQRERDGVYTTLLIDDILALPTVIDGANTVFPGTPLQDELDAKLDKPAEPGQPGQVLKLDADGSSTIWATGGGGGDAVWGGITGDLADQTDLQEALASKADLTSGTVPKSQLPAVEWADIEAKPSFATVAETGSYTDLSNTPTIPTVGSGIITITQGGTSKGSFSVNQTTAQTIEIDAGGAASWDDIQGKPSFAVVATTGSYTDLADKPTIPNVNDATITLTQGGISKGSFSVNQSSPQTIDFDAYTLNTSIITIPIQTTSYTLADGLIYQHTPESATTYQLPIIYDTTHTHTIVLTVYAHSTTSWRIIDQDGTSTLVPLDTITPVLGDMVQYIIQSTPAGLWAASASYLQRGA